MIESHVLCCQECQQQMARLEADDALVAALRGRLFAPTPAEAFGNVPADLVNLLIPHFKKIGGAVDETLKMAGWETAPTVDFVAETLPPAVSVPTKPDVSALHQLGRYEIRGVLGCGGMGAVLNGFDPLLNRSIAIKVLQPEWLVEDGMVERLVREAQAAAAVEHDNIVPIYAVELFDANPCIVMPLLKGETLQQMLERVDGPLPIGEFVRIAREAALGLAAAHTANLIHCDIKPANLWLEAPLGRVKILDFGLAIEHSDGGGKGMISGTPGYLAPEQARGLQLDQRTDIFSLGCVLYRMATGRAPFIGEPPMRALWTVLCDAPAAAAEMNPDLPVELSDLVHRMMSREPDGRPSSMTMVVDVLNAFESRVAERQRRSVRRNWLLATSGAAVLSAVIVGPWAILATPKAAEPVPVTFLGDEPSLDVVIQREDREWPLTLGAEATLSLLPGDYRVRPVAETAQRRLVPEQFVVADQKPQLVRIAFIGELARHAQHTQAVTGVAIFRNTQAPVIFSVGQDRALVRWKPATTAPPVFENLNYSGRCVALAPKGDEVATAGGNKSQPQETVIELRPPDRIDGPVRTLAGHERLIVALAYSPDGKWFASADAEGVLLWDRASSGSQRLQTSDSDRHSVSSLAFSPDSRQLLTGGHQVTVWDLTMMQPTTLPAMGSGSVRAVVFVRNGFAAAGDDGIVRIWSDIDSKPREFVSIGCPILALAAAFDGTRLLTGDADGVVSVWSVATGEVHERLRGHTRAVHAVAFVENGRRAVSAGADGTVRLWQLPFP